MKLCVDGNDADDGSKPPTNANTTMTTSTTRAMKKNHRTIPVALLVLHGLLVTTVLTVTSLSSHVVAAADVAVVDVAAASDAAASDAADLLVCEDIVANDDYTDGSNKMMKCSFLVEKQTTKTNAESPASSSQQQQQKLIIEECKSGVCVKAVVYIYDDPEHREEVASTYARQPASSSLPDGQDQQSTTAKTRTIESTTTSTSATSSSTPIAKAVPTTIYIGDATYSQPYEQYGNGVAELLYDAPPIFVGQLPGDEQIQSIPNNNPSALLDVTNFLLSLGNIHLEFDSQKIQPTTGGGSSSGNIWYQLSLSINAYKAANDILMHPEMTTVLPQYQRDEYRAALHYRIGEAYLADLEMQHLQEAIHQYTLSKDLFRDLISSHPIDKLWMNKGYADASAKVAIAKLSELSSVSSANVMGTTTLSFQNLMTDSFDYKGGGGRGGFGGRDDASSQEDMLQKTEQIMNGEIFMDEESQVKIDKSIREILELFDVSIEAYKQYLDPQLKKEFMRLPLSEKQDYYSSMATAYHHAGTAAMTSQHQLMKAKDYLSNALNLHLNYLLPSFGAGAASSYGSYPDDGRADFLEQSTKTSIGELYLSISNLCIQQGDYPRAKKAYTQTMDWYKNQRMDVPAMTTYESLGIDGDETLQLYVQQLEEYRRMVAAGEHGTGSIPRIMKRDTIYEPKVEDDFGGDLYYYERDDGYEGDLLSAIGAVHLSNGDVDRAIQFLQQALSLYNSDPIQNKRTMADAKINLAMAHFQGHRFDDSKKIHFEALDAYQELYGDGVNPFMQMLDDAAAAMSGEGQGRKQQQQGPNADVLQVDLDKYRTSLLNATSLDDHLGDEL